MVSQLVGRDVDRHPHVAQPLGPPLGGLVHGGEEHEVADIPDHPDLLGDGDEADRRNVTEHGMMPASQGLEPDDAVGARIHLGLEGHAELPAPEGEGELLLDQQPVLGLL